MANKSALTLTQTAFWARHIIKYGAIGIASILILRASWSVGKQVYIKLFPPPPPPPTQAFGTLPSINFPERNLPSQPSYQLETPQGTLPEFPEQAKIFYIPQPRSSFSALDQAKQTASRLGFKNPPEEINKDIIYRFTNPQTQETLVTNIITGTFKLDRPWITNETLLTNQPQSTENAARSALSFLKKANLDATDLTSQPPTFTFFKANPPHMQPVLSLSESNFVKVNFFRDKYDDLPVVTPNPDEALVNLIVGAKNTIIQCEYYYYPILADRTETYPLKTAQTAWDELNAGNAYIATISPTFSNPIKIRKIYLAYYDSKQLQKFFQPVVVFEGDQDFTAYLPAINPEAPSK